MINGAIDPLVNLGGACRCAGSPHPDGEWVQFAPHATLDIGIAAHQALNQFGDDAMGLQMALTRAYTRFGIVAWSFLDDNGNLETLPSERPDWKAALDRLVPWANGGEAIVQRADALYSKEVFDPLVRRLSERLRAGPTVNSTSRSRKSGRQRQKPLRPSSPATTEDGKPSAVAEP